MHVFATTFQSTLGIITLGATDKGLCFAGISKYSAQQLEQLSIKLSNKHNNQRNNITYEDIVTTSNIYLQQTHNQLQEYFAGKRQTFDIKLHLIGTEFQKNVWNILLKIPYGATRSYKQEAEMLGKPTAFRAVANANGKNNIIIIIPCHRVIASGGGLGGYSSGSENKKVLLELERLSLANTTNE